MYCWKCPIAPFICLRKCSSLVLDSLAVAGTDVPNVISLISMDLHSDFFLSYKVNNSHFREFLLQDPYLTETWIVVTWSTIQVSVRYGSSRRDSVSFLNRKLALSKPWSLAAGPSLQARDFHIIFHYNCNSPGIPPARILTVVGKQHPGNQMFQQTHPRACMFFSTAIVNGKSGRDMLNSKCTTRVCGSHNISDH